MSFDKAILEQVIHKVPGNPVQSKKEKQGYVNLSEKTKTDLIELIKRQEHLLKNKEFLKKLPDKGEKIINYKIQLERELSNREKSLELSDMLLKLNINGKSALDKLEWTGNCNPGQSTNDTSNDLEDDDDDEMIDPLKIIASHSGVTSNKKITRILPTESSLIKPTDIEDINQNDKNSVENTTSDNIESTNTPSSSSDKNFSEQFLADEPYIKNLCDKFDKKLNTCNDSKERFLPHKTIKQRQDKDGGDTYKDSIDVISKKKWEVTAATPPPSKYKDIKLLPLEFSVKLQIEQAEKLKVIQMKHATEKLKSSFGKGIGDSWKDLTKTSGFTNPRTHCDSGSSSGDDDDDKASFHSCNAEEEEDPEERRGGITFYNLIDN